MMKTRTQKYQDLIDTHKLLQAHYIQHGPPAGAEIQKLPMKGVPPTHRKIADALLKELKSRQMMKHQLSDESYTTWKQIVFENKSNLFWLRDNLPTLLNRKQHASQTEKPDTPTDTPRTIQSIVLHDGELLVNDRQTHLLQHTESGVQCRLTGKEYPQDSIVSISYEQTD